MPFLPSALTKIKAIKSMLARRNNQHCIISVDGGINEKTGRQAVLAGASCLVAGSFIFSAGDYAKALLDLK
jgi:ribulose-phosphate 3-epimerase